MLVMGGCASLSEKECLSVDWTDQGYRDGRNGQPPSRVEDHREACAKVGVVPNLQQYRKGRDKGVVEYCSPANALRVGRLGHGYRNACPMRLEGAFLANYRLAYRAYQAEQQVQSLDRQVQQKQRALDKEKDAAKRRRLHGELKTLDRRLARARHELRAEERHLRSKIRVEEKRQSSKSSFP